MRGQSLEHELTYGPPPGAGPHGPAGQPPYPPGPYGPVQGQPGPPWPGRPPAPQGGPPAKNKSGRGLVITIVAVVVAAAAGGGAWFWLGGGSGADDVGFAPDAPEQLSMTLEERFSQDWEPDASTAQMSVGSWVDGHWWTEQHLVREMWNEVVAYNLADGSVAWRVPVEGNGACRSSEQASPEGYVAILRGKGFGDDGPQPCDQLTVVDINAGEEVWTSKVTPTVKPPEGREPNSWTLPSAADHPAIWDETVWVPTEDGGLRFDLSDGKQAKRRSSDDDSCKVTDYLPAGDTLMAWQPCGGWTLVSYGPDRELQWAWKLPEDGDDVRLGVLSVDPLIVVVTERYTQQVLRVEPGGPDDPGEHTVLVDADDRDPMSPCPRSSGGTRVLATCTDAIVGDGALYLHYAMDQNYDRKGIVAFDLESGEELWRARANGELSLVPLSVDEGDEDGRLIAFQPQDPPLADYEGSRAAVVAVDPETGGITPLAGLPIEDGGRKWLLANNSLDGAEWRDGHFVIVTQEVVVTEQGKGGGPGSLATVSYT